VAFRLWDNLGLKLFALAAALLLWLLVKGGQPADRLVSARIEFRDLPRGLVLVSRSDGAVLLKLQGPKRVLGALGLDEVAVSLAAREIREGINVVPLGPGDILGTPRGVEVVEVSPRSLRLQVEALVQREVQIQPRIEGDPRPGFVVRRIQLEPRAVRIAGPRSEIRGVAEAYTLPVSVEGRAGGFLARTTLEPIGQQVKFVNEAPVRVSIDIAPRKSGEGRGDSGPPGRAS
jgi:hypothetical protein